MELLKQSQEYLRLKRIESELILQQPSLITNIPLSKWVNAAGYTCTSDLEMLLEEGQEAREILITKNMRLVHYTINSLLSNRSKLKSLSREDLVQEGCIGLSRAIEKYDISQYKKNKFSTYAIYWIRASILRCVAEHDELVRVPEHFQTVVNKVKGAAERIGLDLDHVEKRFIRSLAWRDAQEAKELAQEAGITNMKQLQDAIQIYQSRKVGVLEFEPWMQDADNILDVGLDTPSTGTFTESLLKACQSLLKPKELQALSLRYGLIQPEKKRTISTTDLKMNGKPTQESTSTPEEHPTGFRDYLDEAEEDLFGENGILSDSSPVPNHGEESIFQVKKGKWGEAMSFSEIGKQMAISGEYSRRLCSNALKKLQRAQENGELQLLQPYFI